MVHTMRLLIPLYALRRLSFDLAWLLTERLVSLEFAAALPGAWPDCAHPYCQGRSVAGKLTCTNQESCALTLIGHVQARCGASCVRLRHYRSRCGSCALMLIWAAGCHCDDVAMGWLT